MFVNLLLEVVYQYRCVGNVAENQNASFHPGYDAFPEKDTEIAIGNVIGSNLFNIFFVLGCSASITPQSSGY